MNCKGYQKMLCCVRFMLCTIDVVSLYSHIPHNEGLEAVKEAFATYGEMEEGEWEGSLGEDIQGTK